MTIPKINEICNCCGDSTQPILQLFNDKCFRIVEKDQVHGDFCLGNFAFPVDGYQCTGINLDINGGETTLFDNAIVNASPAELLEEEKLYARGILLRVIYPTNDNDGETLSTLDKSILVYIENVDQVGVTFPLYDLLTWFTNPKSDKVQDLINKIKIINPNTKYKIRVSGLVIYGKATKK